MPAGCGGRGEPGLAGAAAPGDFGGRCGADGEACVQRNEEPGVARGAEGAGNGRSAKLIWVRGGTLARALGVSKPTLQRRAQSEQWDVRQVGNRYEYAPPFFVAGSEQAGGEPRVKFTDLTHDEDARRTVLLRETAVLAAQGRKREEVVAELILREPGFAISMRSLQRWEAAYREQGIDGLVDQKRGRCGRKSAISKLSPDELEQFKRRYQAAAMEHRGIAKAAQLASADPTLPAALRSVIHGSHTSKSYVNASVRNALRVSPLAVALEQGPRHGRLQGRWTPGDYGQVAAGDVYCSDDMTSNVMCWCEWPNAQGWKMGQPQVLPIIDVGSLRWLQVRVIMRESGQYTADDIWGLFGDVFESFGMPAQGFVLEGGHWQSQAVVGHRTGLSDDERIGGLKSLGLQVHRSYDPRSKIIEGQFNELQAWMDACPGWVGREQRYDLPEMMKKAIALCRAGKAHPRQFFPHVSQLADHIHTWMGNINQMRSDGVILRGRSPLEKWAEDAPRLSAMPESARWLYRSAMSVVQVTRNGVRVTQGSGRNLVAHYYDATWLVPHQGQKVVAYWNDHNPQADAVILDAATRSFLGVAKWVQPLGRFGATPEQLESEAKRKANAAAYARTELRAIQPEMQRHQMPVQVDAPTADMGERIRSAAARAEVEEQSRRQTASEIRRTEVSVDDVAAALSSGQEEAEQISSEEISRILSDEE
jgi:hypothetical protein